MAAVRSAGAISTAARGLGQGALALVGGVWGAAALAIGGVAYALYSLHQQQEVAKKAFIEQIATLKELPQHVKDVAKAYRELGSAMTPTALLQEWKQTSDEFHKAQSQIDALK